MYALARRIDNPFRPAEARLIPLTPAATIADLVDPAVPTVVQVNGRWVLQAEWHRPVAAGSMVSIHVLPRGGGGGGSNPLRLIAMIAISVAAPFVTGLIAPAWASSTFIAGNITVANAITAGITLGGALLVNALFPAARPPTASYAQAASAEQSPTYSLTAQGNTARLEQSIPSQYGSFRVYPDYAAQPYWEYSDNEQYLYIVLSVGHGYHDVSEVRIEDTPVENFQEISWTSYGPGYSFAAFHPHVTTSIEVSGQELLGTNEAGHDYIGPVTANASGTTINYVGIDIVAPGGMFQVSPTTGVYSSVTSSWTVEARQINDNGNPIGGWAALASPSLTLNTVDVVRRSYKYSVSAGRYEVRVRRTNAASTETTKQDRIVWGGLRGYLTNTARFDDIHTIALEMRATNNLSNQASRRVNALLERRLPHWGGNYMGSPNDFSDWTESAASAVAAPTVTDPRGKSQAYKLTVDGSTGLHNVYRSAMLIDGEHHYTAEVWAKEGEYDGLRLDFRNTSATASIACTFDLGAGTAGTVTTTGSATGSAVITDAGDGWYRCVLSGNLNNSGYVSGDLYLLLSDGGSTTIAGDSASGVYIYWPQLHTRTRSLAFALADMLFADYGAYLAADQVDVDGLIELHAKWQARQEYLDGVFDTRAPLWQSLQSVARIGRAVPLLQGGRVRFVRDVEQTGIAALFTPDNIRAGSLSIEYVMPTSDMADGVTVTYVDRATWSPKTVTRNASGTATGIKNPATVDLFGCTESSIADREATYMAKSALYRRKVISFDTEYDGFIPTFGDLIGISHDVPDWGQSMTVTTWDAATLTMTVDPAPLWEGDAPFYVGIRDRDGSMAGPFTVTAPGASNDLVLTDSPGATVEAGTLVTFGPSTNWIERARVQSISPRGVDHVTIVAVSEPVDDDGNSLVLYEGKHGDIGPDSLVDYASASDDELAQYLWICDSDGLMGDGSEGWTIGD